MGRGHGRSVVCVSPHPPTHQPTHPPALPTRPPAPPKPAPADGGVVRASAVVLAVGHSARDMYACLLRHDVALTPKAFAMGFRCARLPLKPFEWVCVCVRARVQVHALAPSAASLPCCCCARPLTAPPAPPARPAPAMAPLNCRIEHPQALIDSAQVQHRGWSWAWMLV